MASKEYPFILKNENINKEKCINGETTDAQGQKVCILGETLECGGGQPYIIEIYDKAK